jgi:hypothetical protein
MTVQQEILRQKLCEIIPELQKPYKSGEVKLRSLVASFGMILPDFEPADKVGLYKRHTDFFKSAAKFQSIEEGWSNPKDLAIGYLGEFAFHLGLCFKTRRHRWASIYFGSAKEAPLDFTVYGEIGSSLRSAS